MYTIRYPKNPQTLGERTRKARTDKGMTLKEAVALFGVTDTAVINWEIRGKMPEVSRMEEVKEFIAPTQYFLDIFSKRVKMSTVSKCP